REGLGAGLGPCPGLERPYVLPLLVDAGFDIGGFVGLLEHRWVPSTIARPEHIHAGRAEKQRLVLKQRRVAKVNTMWGRRDAEARIATPSLANEDTSCPRFHPPQVLSKALASHRAAVTPYPAVGGRHALTTPTTCHPCFRV